MSDNIVDKVIKRVNAPPPLPAAVQRLCKMTEDTESSYDQMAEVIASDEVLTTKILHLANSAFYGLSQRVPTISQAVIVIGFHGIRNLAIGVTVFGFRAGETGACPLKREALWRHSLATASGARLLAGHFQLSNWEEVFAGGILHDVGKIIFMECFHQEYARVLQQAVTGPHSLEHLENDTFGIDHAALGAEVCQRWKMPTSLTRMVAMRRPVANGKSSASEPDRMIDTVYLADNLARVMQIGSDGNPNIGGDILKPAQAMELPPEQLRRFILMLPEEVRKVEAFFNIAPEVPEPSATNAGHGVVGIMLANPNDTEIVRLTLLALGCQLTTSAEMMQEKTPLAGVVVDESLPSETRAIFERRGVLLLDFSQWRQENARTKGTALWDITRLRNWLGERLQCSASVA